MVLADRIAEMVRPTIEAQGYSLVRVQVLGQQRPRLQVMAERADGRPMMVDDCAALSRSISAVLDVEDPIATTYTLEVSSPGIDRPLVKLADYDRFAGVEARLELVRCAARTSSIPWTAARDSGRGGQARCGRYGSRGALCRHPARQTGVDRGVVGGARTGNRRCRWDCGEIFRNND